VHDIFRQVPFFRGATQANWHAEWLEQQPQHAKRERNKKAPAPGIYGGLEIDPIRYATEYITMRQLWD
jgi:hypothetical protein